MSLLIHVQIFLSIHICQLYFRPQGGDEPRLFFSAYIKSGRRSGLVSIISFVMFSELNVVSAATMSSAQSLREFIRERLTAAAEEIFTEVDKTIVLYEEELDRLRLLETKLKPPINLQRIEQIHHW
ncbi:hypothetical protein ILYODFUR_025052 [Ilyodon furcidens]|uniref:Uncharacterized protein n=1 Tax=Ilyodon furcidens TaxID=33524 RepID=A0ABV0TED3_9TELE